jgi:hypothetical protein
MGTDLITGAVLLIVMVIIGVGGVMVYERRFTGKHASPKEETLEEIEEKMHRESW